MLNYMKSRFVGKRSLILFVLFFAVFFSCTINAQELGLLKKGYEISFPEKIKKPVPGPLPRGTYSIGSNGNFWKRINSPTTQRLNSIVFMDSLNGWVSGDSGTIIHTSDGGETWDTQFSNDTLNVVDLFFLDDQTGWASAWSFIYEPYGTFILKTTNGGINWKKELLDVGEKFVISFYFLNTTKGFAVGYPCLFKRTDDGGATWINVNLDSCVLAGFPPYTVKFLNDQYGYACGGVRGIAGVVWRTTDGGVNWATVVDTLTFEPVYDIHFFDSLNVIAMGGDPYFGASQVQSTDGGNTWEYKLLGTIWFPVDIGFRTATEGWCPLGCERKFFYTSDSGQNWIEFDTPDFANIVKISFPDSIHGFGIGENGDMIKYIYPVIPVVVEVEIASPTKFMLEQNYPNPFNPTTKIKYSIPEMSKVSLTLFNLLGEEVATLFNEEKQTGYYTIEFNAANLPSGVYFYQLRAGSFIETKKMILLK